MPAERLDLALTPSQVATLLPPLIRSGINVMLWGPPGIGKSALVAQAVQTLKRRLYPINAVLYDPVDLRGLCKFSEKTLRDGRTITTTTFAPTEMFALEDDDATVFFFDELPQAPMLTQNALLSVVWEKRLGSLILPAGCAFVAAGNRVGDRAGAGATSTALNSRFAVHIDVTVSAEDSLAYMFGAGIRADIRSYLAVKADHLMIFDGATRPRAFPCPRTWCELSRALDAIPGGATHPQALAVIAGAIGEEVAPPFKAHAAIFGDLVPAKDIVADPTGARVPPENEPALCHAVAAMLADYARKCSKAELPALHTYGERLAPEFGVLLFRDIQFVRPEFLELPAMTTWLNANVDLLAPRPSTNGAHR